LLIIATIIGVAVGVPLSKKRHNNSNNNIAAGNSPGNDTNSNGSGTLPPANNGPDPSVFTKNPNFHQSFYGIAYSPEGSLLPNCGNNLGQLTCIE
jgi:hypothetical protein